MTVATAEKAALGSTQATAGNRGAHVHSPQYNQSNDPGITFIRPSAAGPPLDLSSLPKSAPATSTNKTRSPISKLTLKTNKPAPSTSGDKIDWTATETKTTPTPPKKPFGNVDGVIGAIKPAPGLNKGKGKDKEKVAVPEKKEQDKDKNDKEVKEFKDGKKGKGKENITPTGSVVSGSSGTPGKVSYAQMLSRS
jgi:hypothetical protein